MAKKEVVTFEMLKGLMQTYVALDKDPMMDAGEWAYACLEPVLFKSPLATIALVAQLDAEEFEALGMYFEDIVHEFQSDYALELIRALYHKYYGDNLDTETYTMYVDGLEHCLNSDRKRKAKRKSRLLEASEILTYGAFLRELLLNEAECATFIAEGHPMTNPGYLRVAFDHFKSEKIYDAIRKNCEIAFAGERFTESEEIAQYRRTLLTYMAETLGLNT